MFPPLAYLSGADPRAPAAARHGAALRAHHDRGRHRRRRRRPDGLGRRAVDARGHDFVSAADQIELGRRRRADRTRSSSRARSSARSACSRSRSRSCSICLHAQRAGLLGRFMGVVGMFAGATIIIRQFDPPGVVRSFWLVALALLILDQRPAALAPCGKPPAWAVAEAVPWPSQQQTPRGARGRAAQSRGRARTGARVAAPARAGGAGRRRRQRRPCAHAEDRPRPRQVPAPRAPRAAPRGRARPGRAAPLLQEAQAQAPLVDLTSPPECQAA